LILLFIDKNIDKKVAEIKVNVRKSINKRFLNLGKLRKTKETNKLIGEILEFIDVIDGKIVNLNANDLNPYLSSVKGRRKQL